MRYRRKPRDSIISGGLTRPQPDTGFPPLAGIEECAAMKRPYRRKARDDIITLRSDTPFLTPF